MGNLFHSWRRTIGVVTLMMALVFMAGWIWSYSILDVVVCNGGRYTDGWLRSSCGEIILNRYYSGDAEILLGAVVWEQSPLSSIFYFDFADIHWRWRLGGFRFGESYDDRNAIVATFFVIPYWSVVLPLTLLSACLLLTKARPTKQSEKNDPRS
jgi:hypothetical protein